METVVRDEILKRLDQMPQDKQRRALDMIRAMDSQSLRGTPGRELLDLAGTLSLDDAAQMTLVIDEEFEQVDADGW